MDKSVLPSVLKPEDLCLVDLAFAVLPGIIQEVYFRESFYRYTVWAYYPLRDDPHHYGVIQINDLTDELVKPCTREKFDKAQAHMRGLV